MVFLVVQLDFRLVTQDCRGLVARVFKRIEPPRLFGGLGTSKVSPLIDAGADRFWPVATAVGGPESAKSG